MNDTIIFKESDESAALAANFLNKTQAIFEAFSENVADNTQIIRDENGVAYSLQKKDGKIRPFIEIENLLHDPLMLGYEVPGLFTLESWKKGDESDSNYTLGPETEYGGRHSIFLNDGDPIGNHYVEQFIDFENGGSPLNSYKFAKSSKIFASLRCGMLEGIDGNIRVGVRLPDAGFTEIIWSDEKAIAQSNEWETLNFEIDTGEVINDNFYFVIWTGGTFLYVSAAYCGFTPSPAYFPDLVYMKYKTDWNPVLDGDTIRVSRLPGYSYPDPGSSQAVRLLCMDTPETPPSVNDPIPWMIPNLQWLDLFGAKADEYAQDFLPDGDPADPAAGGEKDVWLVFDRNSGKDAFNRLLAYVEDEYATDLGFEQLKKGYARNFMTSERFRGPAYDTMYQHIVEKEIGIYAPRPVFNSFQLQGNDLESTVDLSEKKITIIVNEMFDLENAVVELDVESRVWLIHSGDKIIQSGSTLNLLDMVKNIEVAAGSTNPKHMRWLLEIVMESLNQVSNPFFHGDGAAFYLGWNVDDFQTYTGGDFDPLVLPRSGRVAHSFVSDRNWDYVVANFETSNNYAAAAIVRANTNVSGTSGVWGYIRIGVKRKGFSTFQYSDWVEVNQYIASDWIEIHLNTAGVNDANAPAEVRIQTTSRLGSPGNPEYPVDIIIGGVWFSDIQAPEGWY